MTSILTADSPSWAVAGTVEPGVGLIASPAEGEQYEIDFGDGVRAVYRPWSSKNLYAHSGEFEMVVPDRPDAKSLDRALERMEKIGLKANVATPENAEILYLPNQAYLTKADKSPGYTQMVSSLDQRNASKTERVQSMRAFWEKRLWRTTVP